MQAHGSFRKILSASLVNFKFCFAYDNSQEKLLSQRMWRSFIQYLNHFFAMRRQHFRPALTSQIFQTENWSDNKCKLCWPHQCIENSFRFSLYIPSAVEQHFAAFGYVRISKFIVNTSLWLCTIRFSIHLKTCTHSNYRTFFGW